MGNAYGNTWRPRSLSQYWLLKDTIPPAKNHSLRKTNMRVLESLDADRSCGPSARVLDSSAICPYLIWTSLFNAPYRPLRIEGAFKLDKSRGFALQQPVMIFRGKLS